MDIIQYNNTVHYIYSPEGNLQLFFIVQFRCPQILLAATAEAWGDGQRGQRGQRQGGAQPEPSARRSAVAMLIMSTPD